MKYTTIYIANDHTGVETKWAIIEHLKAKGLQVINLGVDNNQTSVNYVDYANKVALSILNATEPSLGILICGSGIGISIAANRWNHIRCALLYNNDVAQLAKKHNDANIIAFGAREMALNDILERIDLFLSTEFEGGRHQVRIDSMD